MNGVMDIKVNKVSKSRISEVSFDDIPFGKIFSDHMLVADFENGEWKNPEIVPYGNLSLSPANAAIHYGQSIFEGIKAYKDKEGNAFIFRPYDNYKRFNISADRMQMPEVPEDIFMEGMRMLVEMESAWIPQKEDHSLYIRPFMFATDEVIGVKPSDTFKFMILLSPTGPYYSKPMKIYVEEEFVRAVPGGVGYAKAAGNYGGSMYPTALAKKKGFDQVLWTDAYEHKYVQEIGTMNVIFIMGNKAVTPGLSAGTILAGVTRDSVLTLLKEMGLEIEERPLSIDEIVASYKAGELKEVFGTGTAATISVIEELGYRDFCMKFDLEKNTVAATVKKTLANIREGIEGDKYGWMMKVS